MCTRGQLRRGFTLVELLVVITIIGILIALLLPAVQAAREAARKMQCSNNLKQLALGMLQHENANGKFPSGGWTDGWVGDATRGFGLRQPGSWVYSILPYIDELPLFQMSASDPVSQQLMWHGVVSNQGAMNLIATPLVSMSCPTRRPAVAYPTPCFFLNPPSSRAPLCSKGDYAANSGDMLVGSSVRVCSDNGPTAWPREISGRPIRGRISGPLTVGPQPWYPWVQACLLPGVQLPSMASSFSGAKSPWP